MPMDDVPAPGTMYREPGPQGRLFFTVTIAEEAGGGTALVLAEGFDPRKPTMLPIWSARVNDFQPASARELLAREPGEGFHRAIEEPTAVNLAQSLYQAATYGSTT